MQIFPVYLQFLHSPTRGLWPTIWESPDKRIFTVIYAAWRQKHPTFCFGFHQIKYQNLKKGCDTFGSRSPGEGIVMFRNSLLIINPEHFMVKGCRVRPFICKCCILTKSVSWNVSNRVHFPHWQLNLTLTCWCYLKKQVCVFVCVCIQQDCVWLALWYLKALTLSLCSLQCISNPVLPARSALACLRFRKKTQPDYISFFI